MPFLKDSIRNLWQEELIELSKNEELRVRLKLKKGYPEVCIQRSFLLNSHYDIKTKLELEQSAFTQRKTMIVNSVKHRFKIAGDKYGTKYQLLIK